MKSAEDSIEAVGKVLGEPAFLELTENAWKIRTNLILTSVISIAVVFGDLHIEPDSQILGLKFKGLSDEILTNGLIALVTYLLFHFLWVSVDSLLEWRLRVTGTRVAFVTTARLASEHGDYPSDPRQSTLYNWWKDEARKIGHIEPKMQEMNERLSHWESEMQAKFSQGADATNIANAIGPVVGLRKELAKVTREIKAASACIEGTRVPASLERFDSWFCLYLRSQNLRWLVVEFLAPVLVGGYALFVLVAR
ncbi:MAG: hypothetical protein WC023_08235 [Rhodocyclaceae bacterium]